MLPTFIIIGAMKCGTSSLYHYLSLHPEVFMARARKSTKTIHFFTTEKNYRKGIQWYESLFAPPTPERFKAYGEASGTYTKFPIFTGAPENMHRHVPNIKLIYLVRDPVSRIISHYRHKEIEGYNKKSLTEELSNLNSNLVQTSMYYRQISRYLKFFSKEQIMIVSTEQMKKNRRAVLQNIFSFTGVERSFYTPAYDVMSHQTSKKIIRRPLEQSATLPNPKHPESELEESILASLDHKLINALISYLKPDVDALRELTEQPFSEWRL